MSNKNLWDIYCRNISGVFRNNPGDGKDNPSIVFQWIVYIIFLPITLIIFVGIKTLIDFFSRKEIKEEKMLGLKDKIELSSDEDIILLVKNLSIFDVQSRSSHKLILTLKAASTETAIAMARSGQDAKRVLQEEQYNSENNVGSIIDRGAAISNTKLNPARQQQLDDYINSNTAHCTQQKLEIQKRVLTEYLDAKHNSGKRLQHTIYNHFFSRPAIIENKNSSLLQKSITSLPIHFDSIVNTDDSRNGTPISITCSS